MSLCENLCELLEVRGVSGFENEIDDFLYNKLMKLCGNAHRDEFGNVTANVNCSDESAPTLMLEAHLDQVGLIVSEITDDGIILFDSLGGIDPRILPAAGVCIMGNNDTYGVIFINKTETGSETKKSPGIKHLAIDTGYNASELKEIVSIGDPIILKSHTLKLQNGVLSGKCLDNRSGIAAILNCLENLDKSKLRYNLAVAFTSQEELGLKGAKSVAVKLKPDFAVVIDVTHGMTPDAADDTGAFELGSGTIICRGPNIDYDLSNKLIKMCERENIKYKIEVAAGCSGTNAWAIQTQDKGIPVMLISIPLRYMHTTVETLLTEDVEIASDVLKRIAEGGVTFDKAII